MYFRNKLIHIESCALLVPKIKRNAVLFLQKFNVQQYNALRSHHWIWSSLITKWKAIFQRKFDKRFSKKNGASGVTEREYRVLNLKVVNFGGRRCSQGCGRRVCAAVPWKPAESACTKAGSSAPRKCDRLLAGPALCTVYARSPPWLALDFRNIPSKAKYFSLIMLRLGKLNKFCKF